MAHLKRSTLLVFVLVPAVLLAACGSTPSSVAPTATTPTLVKGEFIGDAGTLAGIALSTNGQRVIAYVCDGTDTHISLAEWFTGPVTATGIDLTNAHGAHLVATLSAQTITGAVTLKDGRSAPFSARLPIPAATMD